MVELRKFNRRHFIIAAALLATSCAAPMVQHAATFRSDRLSVITVGEGPDVVLVPGLGSSRQVWESTVRNVPGYRYHLVQINGFAGYAAGANESGPIIASAAEEIARYIRDAGLQRPAIIGHSMGGSTALMVAARHDLLSRVMVVDMLPFLGILFGPPGTTAESVRATADKLRDQALAATAEARHRTVAASIDTMIMNQAHRPAAVRDALASDRNISARALHELIVTDLRPELSRIKVPLTVLHVKTPNVPLTPEQFDAIYQQSYSPVSQVTVKRIPDSYHFIMFDNPGRYISEVQEFLTGSRKVPSSQ